jgi:hypothetical protein
MSDTDNAPEPTQEVVATPPTQPEPATPAPQPERVSFDPDGNRYIRTDPNGDE